jgi:hypothetical protein
VLERAMGNTNTQDSSRPRLGGNHHLPLYSILYGWPRSPHLNGFLSRDSQMGILKLPNLGLPQLWNPIILQTNLQLRCNLKKSCSFHQELSNDKLHTFYKQVNWVNSKLLVVRSQIGNLTLGPSFGHNLCFRFQMNNASPF